MGNKTLKFKIAMWAFLRIAGYAVRQGIGTIWMQNKIEELLMEERRKKDVQNRRNYK